MTKQFITQSELSREARVPVNRIQAAVEVGLIAPVGRAGNYRHAPMIFEAADLPRLIEALQTGVSFRAGSKTEHIPHRCQNPGEVMQKYHALQQAAREVAV